MPNPSNKRGATPASAVKDKDKQAKTLFTGKSPQQQKTAEIKRDRNRAPQSKDPQGKISNGSRTQLEKFFHEQVRDLYWAEKHLTKALPKMQNAATSADLKAAIQDHTVQTREHVTRLEQVFELLGKKAQAKKCDAMEALVKEGETAVESTEPGSMTRDVAIIMSSQKVEHYEIAGYGTLVRLAETMGIPEAAAILTKTLDEEKQSDQKLSGIAGNNIIQGASEEEEKVPDLSQEAV